MEESGSASAAPTISDHATCTSALSSASAIVRPPIIASHIGASELRALVLVEELGGPLGAPGTQLAACWLRSSVRWTDLTRVVSMTSDRAIVDVRRERRSARRPSPFWRSSARKVSYDVMPWAAVAK